MSRQCDVCNWRRAEATGANMLEFVTCEVCDQRRAEATAHGMAGYMVCEACRAGDLAAGSVETTDGRFSVLVACEHLHGVVSGAIVCDPAETQRTYAMLSDRVKNWRPAPDFTAVYDSAVYTLARIALDEYQRSIK